MRQSDYQFSRTKKKLLEYQNNGRKEVCWRLTKPQVQFVEKTLGKEVRPYLYEVQTRIFKNPQKLESGLLKKLHYERRKGKKHIILKKLSKPDMMMLDSYGINYKCIKHQIILR